MHKEIYRDNRGQSLIEVLIAIAVGVIIIGGVAATISVTLRSNVQSKNGQTATALAQETLNELTDFTGANWHNIDTLNVSPAQYYLSTSTSALSSVSGSETMVLDGKQFTRYFSYDNVSRDGNGSIEASYSGAANNDPSTKKLNVTVSWTEGSSVTNVTLNKYVTRSKNLVFVQTDWSGGGAQVGPITAANNKYDTKGGNMKTSNVGYLRTVAP